MEDSCSGLVDERDGDDIEGIALDRAVEFVVPVEVFGIENISEGQLVVFQNN